MHSPYAQITFVNALLFPDFHFVFFDHWMVNYYSVSAIDTALNICVCHLFVLIETLYFEKIDIWGLRQSSPNVTIFYFYFLLQNFSLNSIAYIYLLVKFLFCLFFCFLFVFICHQLWWIKMYVWPLKGFASCLQALVIMGWHGHWAVKVAMSGFGQVP